MNAPHSIARALPAAVLLALLPAAAPAGGTFSIPRATVDAGGGRSDGGVFTLTGTIGQPDAGAASGGVFALSGGFWASAAPAGGDADGIFKDGFESTGGTP